MAVAIVLVSVWVTPRDSTLASVMVVGALVALEYALILVWRRWPLIEEVTAARPSTRWDRIGRSIVIPGSRATWNFVVVVVATFGLIGIARDLLEAGSIAGRATAAAVLGIGLVFGLWSMFNHVARRRLFAGTHSVTDAIQQVALIAVFAAAAFAFFTQELYRHGLVQFTQTGDPGGGVANVDPDGLYWFYGWHLIDALPSSPLTTLRVDPPYDYDQSRVGVLLLLYTLVVVTPFLGLVKEFQRRRNSQDAIGQATAVATGGGQPDGAGAPPPIA